MSPVPTLATLRSLTGPGGRGSGVDAALLHTNDMLVRDPTFYQGICSAFPGRFYAMAPSNEALITTDSAAAVEGIRRGVTTCGLHAIKFHINTWYNHTDERWDDNDSIRPYWEAATSLGVPVFFTPGHGPIAGQGHGSGFSNMYPGSASSGAAAASATKTAMQRGFIDEMATLVRSPYPPSHARLPGSALTLAVALLACLRWTREPRCCC